MVVVLISVVVVAAAFTLYRVNVTHYLREDARLERDQNLRAALAAIARDVRMAGNGYALLGAPNILQFIQVWVPGRESLDQGGRAVQTRGAGWFKHADVDENPENWGARPIFGVDGGETGSDTLTVFRAEVESGAPLGHLDYAFDFSGPLNLVREYRAGALRGNDIVVLVNGALAALAEVHHYGGERGVPILPPSRIVHLNHGGRFTPPAGTAALSFPPGTSVYNLRDVVLVTYYLDRDTHRLMANHHHLGLDDEDSAAPGHVVVAGGIEDFQVFYYFNNEEVNPRRFTPPKDAPLEDHHGLSSAKLDVRQANFNRVKAVALGLTARTPRPHRDAKPAPRPALFNRREGDEPDRHTRNVLTEIVHLRNF
jgi:hypothetical protein